MPATEGRKINACSWSSTKFSHRAPDDFVLMRVFIGGAFSEDLAEQDEATLIDIARQELREIMGITATPVLARAYRWTKSNPQYNVGHSALVGEIDQLAAAHPGLYLAGAAYRGSGIPDCIQSGFDTAAKIVATPNLFKPCDLPRSARFRRNLGDTPCRPQPRSKIFAPSRSPLPPSMDIRPRTRSTPPATATRISPCWSTGR